MLSKSRRRAGQLDQIATHSLPFQNRNRKTMLAKCRTNRSSWAEPFQKEKKYSYTVLTVTRGRKQLRYK